MRSCCCGVDYVGALLSADIGILVGWCEIWYLVRDVVCLLSNRLGGVLSVQRAWWAIAVPL